MTNNTEFTECALRNKIKEMQFVCVELNLYLDTHPTDAAARADYLCFGKKLRALIDKYAQLYGPLQNFGHTPTSTGCYVMSDWPWQ